MLETSLLIQIVIISVVILGYTAYLINAKKEISKQKQEERDNLILSFSDSKGVILNRKDKKNISEQYTSEKKLSDQNEDQMTYSIVLSSDIKLIEEENFLLIKGSVDSIAKICDEFSNMDQLPEGFCVKLGDWKLYILEYTPQSSIKHKTIVMPGDNWYSLSCQLRDSISENDLQANNYENFAFKKVLEYSIEVEATDFSVQKKAESFCM